MMRHILPILSASLLFLETAAYAQTYSKETVPFRDTLKMDIYFRGEDSPGKPRPVFIWSFGGGWESGSREIDLSQSLYRMLLDDGFVLVSIDYRLGVKEAKRSGEMPSPDHINLDSKSIWNTTGAARAIRRSIRMGVEDLYDATSCLLRNAARWNIDSSKIIVGGGSAGAINSINAEYLRCNADPLATAHLPEGFRYAGVFGGATSIWLDAPMMPVWGSTPCPVILFHGSADTTVPYGNLDLDCISARMAGSSEIASSLREAGSPYVLYTGKDYDHVMSGIPATDYAYEAMGFIHRLFLKGEKLMVEIDETDLCGPKTLLRFFMESMGMTEDEVKARATEVMEEQALKNMEKR